MTLFRTLALACSLMILAAVLVLPAHTQGHSSIPMTEQVRFPQGRDSVSVPFENWGEHLIIPVSVNGRPPLQMVRWCSTPACRSPACSFMKARSWTA